MKTHNLAFIDVETTGLDPEVHEIIDLGLVLVRQVPQEGKGPALEVLGEWEYKIAPEHLDTADPESLAIAGYSPEKWADALPLKDAMEDFAVHTKGASFVAHNVLFDAAFVNRAFEQTGVQNRMHYHKIDTISLAFARLYHDPNIEKFSLRALCEYFGIVNEKAHTALSDARATLEVYKKLLDL